MSDFINTIDVLGDDVVTDSIINRTITEFKDDQITKINNSGAFKGCSQLKTVWLPNADFDGTTQIGYQFDSCTSLVDVQIPSAKMLGRLMFNNCTSLEHLVLPNVIKLNMQTFTGCSNLTTLEFHKTINTFGTGHINWCSKLKGIIFRGDGVVPCSNNPNWVGTPYQDGTGYIYVLGSLVSSYKSAENWSTIADQFRGIIDDKEALQGIIDETLVDFENNEITEIPVRAFYKYVPLKSVKSDSVTEIGESAFENCTSLETVEAPNVTHLGTNYGGVWRSLTFNGCTNLKSVYMPLLERIGHEGFKKSAIKTADFPLLTNMGNAVFQECTSLTTVNLPLVNKLGSWAFKYTGLEEVHLPSVTEVGVEALGYCQTLKIVDLPAVSRIQTGAFRSSSAMKALVMLNKDVVCSLDDIAAFADTPIANGTGFIYVPGNLLNTYKSAANWSTFAEQFRGIIADEDALQGIIDETLVDYENNEIIEIPTRAFYKYTPLKSVKSTSVETVDADAFNDCTALENAELLGATTIQHRAFLNCASLESIKIPNVNTIRDYAFSNCSKLKEVVFEADVWNVTNSAFENCTALKKVEFKKASILKYANYKNTALSTLILRNTKVDTLNNVNALEGTPISNGTGYIYVPRTLIENYKVAENWSTYAAQFRALEDYTVDGTTTGELDESKI